MVKYRGLMGGRGGKAKRNETRPYYDSETEAELKPLREIARTGIRVRQTVWQQATAKRSAIKSRFAARAALRNAGEGDDRRNISAEK